MRDLNFCEGYQVFRLKAISTNRERKKNQTKNWCHKHWMLIWTVHAMSTHRLKDHASLHTFRFTCQTEQPWSWRHRWSCRVCRSPWCAGRAPSSPSSGGDLCGGASSSSSRGPLSSWCPRRWRQPGGTCRPWCLSFCWGTSRGCCTGGGWRGLAGSSRSPQQSADQL